MLILIPAYKPDASLVRLIENLDASASTEGVTARVLVVNDGSGPDYTPIFEQVAQLGNRLAPAPSLERRFDQPGITSVTVLDLPSNEGKGAALKAGITWAQQQAPGEVVVTADADGQHLPADILAVGRETQAQASAGHKTLVMGVRTIADPAAPTLQVPVRSRVGNALTAFLFRLSTGQNLADTQTGLRGLTPQILPWALALPGDRYEYEFTMLLRATRHGVQLAQVPITKVYEPGNPTSHFQPVRDSLRIYAPLLLFLASSFSGFLIDTAALMLLVAAGVPLAAAVVGARICSALCNFALNRVVMHDGAPRPATGASLVRYGLLAVTLLALNAGALQALTWVGVPLLAAKILVEVALIPVSFAVQRRWVFSEPAPAPSPAPSLAVAGTRQDSASRPVPVLKRQTPAPAYAEHVL
ncbi:bifunctional glycosyltransferase family 2/GtrA family protein [Rothia nasimurium]|uniref:bifunctional glycosyltransferase family 2/GtrA family protein n=1 Tax=Rothia nasimurium TaxID=85336 RepID=UPI001F165130|nr:bifunctional glycosyltransferase family 2/GtrA family protein [Rothia nasimurium]